MVDDERDGGVPLGEAAEDGWAQYASATGLDLPAGLPFDEWQRIGDVLVRMEKSVHWWIGDWWRYGERSYGEAASQAAPLGYALSTVKNAAWIATRFSESSRRRDDLTFAHHAEVAGLHGPDGLQDVELQERLLDEAEAGKWTRQRLRAEAAKVKAQVELERAVAEADAAPSDQWRVLTGRFQDVAVDPCSVDVVIVDPPYGEEHLGLWCDLGEWATAALRPGGILAAMSGQTYLPDVLDELRKGGPDMEYRWTIAYLTPGGQSVQVWPRKVNTFWKPVFVFSKGEPDLGWMGDVARSDPNDNDKRFHDWGQSESGMADLVGRVSKPGWLVADPMMGAGTTGVAALSLTRRFLGVDVDPSKADTARKRLSLVAGR